MSIVPTFKVFYAWQTDTPGRENRNFIEDAVKVAIKKIVRDSALEQRPEIDSATAGMSGAPAIADSIFRKIDSCGAFVADVTLVGQLVSAGPKRSRPTPNANVLIEVGYAAKAINWERVILVMNTALGGPEELPFDLRGRLVLKYKLLPTEQPADARRGLAVALEEAIRLTFNATQPIPVDEVAMSAQVKQMASDFRDDLKERRFGSADGNLGTGIDGHVGALGLLIVPEKVPGSLSLQDAIARRVEFQPFRCSSWGHRIRSGKVLFSGVMDPPVTATELAQTGVLRAAVTDIFQNSPNSGTRQVPWEAFSLMPLERASKYLQTLEQIGVRGPWWVAIFLLDLPLCQPTGWFGGDGQRIRGDILPPPARIENVSPEGIARALKPALDFIWQDFYQTPCALYDESGNLRRVGP